MSSFAEQILAVFAAIGGLLGLVIWAAGRLSQRQAQAQDDAVEAMRAAERAERLAYEAEAQLAPPAQLSERERAWCGGRRPMIEAMLTAKAKRRQQLGPDFTIADFRAEYPDVTLGRRSPELE